MVAVAIIGILCPILGGAGAAQIRQATAALQRERAWQLAEYCAERASAGAPRDEAIVGRLAVQLPGAALVSSREGDLESCTVKWKAPNGRYEQAALVVFRGVSR
jgi:type II secretory pathway pseudopilin PulG